VKNPAESFTEDVVVVAYLQTHGVMPERVEFGRSGRAQFFYSNGEVDEAEGVIYSGPVNVDLVRYGVAMRAISRRYFSVDGKKILKGRLPVCSICGHGMRASDNIDGKHENCLNREIKEEAEAREVKS